MTAAAALFRWHRQVIGSGGRHDVDTPRIAFIREYMRQVDGRIGFTDQATADRIYRTWHGPDGEYLIHNKPLRRQP